MAKVKSAEEYILRHPEWKSILSVFRDVLDESELEENIKWGIPYYTLGKKNIVGFAAFKNHVALWFPNGVFLDDPDNLLINAQEGVTKAGRQLRYTADEKPDRSIIKNFINQAIANQKAGKELKPETKKSVSVPTELLDAFSDNPDLEDHFNFFTPFKQREFCEYISDAKQQATKERRLVKIIPMIEKQIGLHDKYR
ncbi:MAG: DUF1801 domain-containing protein [Balneolaceae bacterium]